MHRNRGRSFSTSRSRSGSVKRNKPESTSSQDDSVCEKSNATKKTKTGAEKQRSLTIPDHFAIPGDVSSARGAQKQHTTKPSNVDPDSDTGACAETDPNSLPTGQDLVSILRRLDDRTARIDLNIVVMNKEIQRLRGEVFDLQMENSNLKEELSKCKQREEDMQRRLRESSYRSELALRKAEENKQYSRRNNFKMLYIKEEENATETTSECEDKVLDVFKNKLGLHIKHEHIEIAHRVGKKEDGNTRPIIVKFISRKHREEVIENRRKLKNSSPKIVVVEDLTKYRYTLLRKAMEDAACKRAWSSRGKIYAMDQRERIHRLLTFEDLRKLEGGSMASNSPRSVGSAASPAQRVDRGRLRGAGRGVRRGK